MIKTGFIAHPVLLFYVPVSRKRYIFATAPHIAPENCTVINKQTAIILMSIDFLKPRNKVSLNSVGKPILFLQTTILVHVSISIGHVHTVSLDQLR